MRKTVHKSTDKWTYKQARIYRTKELIEKMERSIDGKIYCILNTLKSLLLK